MKILSIEPFPAAFIDCVVPTARGGRQNSCIPILRSTFQNSTKPQNSTDLQNSTNGLRALIVASDLQAREPGKRNQSIGVCLAETLVRLTQEWGIQPSACGVILAGDLYTTPDLRKRFGVGDVSDTWDAFAGQFRWVVGVLGNVDRLSKSARKRHHLLEGRSIVLDGLRIGGVGGIIGNSRMENRREEKDFIDDLTKVIATSPDIIVLHDGPSITGSALPGNDAVRRALQCYDGVVICGHNSWPVPMSKFKEVTVLNCDGRCIVLQTCTPIDPQAK